MEIITMPRPIRWFWVSLGAYWLTGIIHQGFFSVAIMALLMIPILILDLLFPPKNELEIAHIKPEQDEATPETSQDS